MTLVKRNRPELRKQQQNHVQSSVKNESFIISKRKHLLSSCGFATITIILLLFFFLAIITWKASLLNHFPSHNPNKNYPNGASELIGKDGKYQIFILFDDINSDDASKHGLRTSPQEGEDGIIVVSSLGPHRIVVQTQCDCPPIWIRVVGDGMIPISLIQQQRQQKEGYEDWEGEFTLPMEGQYRIEDRWYGCDNEKGNFNPSTYESTKGLAFQVLHAVGEGTSEENLYLTNSNSPLSIFGFGAWISSKKVVQKKTGTNDYVWANPQSMINKTLTLIDYQLKGGDSTINAKGVIAKEGTVSPQHDFYSFSQLGNYELVCWIGSQSAKEIYSAFLAIRPLLFSHQRPFKFHYYEATSFIHPDATWDLETKMRFRKCKHVLVSIDEVKNPTSSGDNTGNDAKLSQLSHDEYRAQLITFVNHLVKAIDDDTFPIWIFTVMQPPMEATNCHNTVAKDSTVSKLGQKSSEHPCNIILKDLFREHIEESHMSPVFPNRVRLLDNSDLSLPQWNREGYADIIAAVALRIFVLVGHRVKEWRDVGQSGIVKGLMRNGVLEPNFELVPYNWS